jgi:hypothetical protein
MRGALFILCLAAISADRLAAAEGDSDLWSLRPITNPPEPAVRDATWPRDAIDRFVLARLETAGLKPNPEADRAALIRRLAYDLTGLPPTQAEVEGSKEYETLVDRYLDSPRFGEQWGRHWLDVARYADNTGRAWNAPLTYAWRYRDYVINAFNKDKPYDRFITEQLAGDLLPAKSIAEERENRIATGFLALGAHDLQNLSHEQFVMDGIDDQIDVTTRAFLGLSVACARCHDHKYDPITVRDYYALAGVFYSTTMLPGVAHQRESGGGGYVNPEKLQILPTTSGRAQSPVSGMHSMYDYQDRWRSGERKILFTTDPNLAMGVAAAEPRDCEIRNKGEPSDRGEAPPRGDLRIPGLPKLPPIPADAGGRLELAGWLTSADNPLTARVMVNRVWQHLFGRGLVRTVDDFGANAEPPTHPELLDHLATRFREDGWSLKRLIRAIVLSRTYRQSSASQPAGQERDPDNTLLWRMNRKRLAWEPLRDSLLEVSGQLTDKRPTGIQVSGIGGKSRLSQVTSLLPLDSPHRTVYLPVLRDKLAEEYSLFDFPNPSLLQGQREVTTVAPQALFFMNGQFVVKCARETAERLLASAGSSDDQRAAWAYQEVLRRSPTAEETADAIALVNSLDRDLSDEYRWAALVQALFATAEFRYVH